MCGLCCTQVCVLLHTSCSGGNFAECSLAGTATVIKSNPNLNLNSNLNHTANPNA